MPAETYIDVECDACKGIAWIPEKEIGTRTQTLCDQCLKTRQGPSPNKQSLTVADDDETSLVASIAAGAQALATASTNLERIGIRDQARAAKAAAVILKRQDIQVSSAELVARAERAIAKANPKLTKQQRDQAAQFHAERRRKQKERGEQQTSESHDNHLISLCRRIHDPIPDQQFEAILEAARQYNEPVTRAELERVGKTNSGKDRLHGIAKRKSSKPASKEAHQAVDRISDAVIARIEHDDIQQQEAAHAIGLTISTMYHILSEQRSMSLSVLLKVLRWLDTDPEDTQRLLGLPVRSRPDDDQMLTGFLDYLRNGGAGNEQIQGFSDAWEAVRESLRSTDPE